MQGGKMAKLEQASLFDVFYTKVFAIPDYQRGYAWEKQQVEDLIDDLSLMPPGKPHFFGTLVLSKTGQKLEDEKNIEFPVYEIIDGQQRLTTSVIFLSVIHKEMKANLDYFKKQPEGISDVFLSYLDGNSCPKPKLILNQDCREYFEANILGFNSISLHGITEIRSHRLIWEAKTNITAQCQTTL